MICTRRDKNIVGRLTFVYLFLALTILPQCSPHQDTDNTREKEHTPEVQEETAEEIHLEQTAYFSDDWYLTFNANSSDSLVTARIVEEYLERVIPTDSLYGLFDTIFFNNSVHFLVGGDIAMKSSELKLLLLKENIEEGKYGPETKETVGTKLNMELYQDSEVKLPDPNNLTYCINQKSFGQEYNWQYEKMQEYMEVATKAWEGVCNVKFIYKEEFDLEIEKFEKPPEVYFVIQKFRTQKKGFAKSFYPYQKEEDRIIFFYSPFFYTEKDPVGITIHELGHMLGFRHSEINNQEYGYCWKREIRLEHVVELSQYDEESVMRQFLCEPSIKQLKISEKDSLGALVAYPF